MFLFSPSASWSRIVWLLLMSVGILFSGPAQAATSRRVYLLADTTLKMNRPVNAGYDPVPVPVKLVTLTVSLKPGETRFLEGRLAARSNTTGTVEQRVWLDCFGNKGEKVYASRNHEGTDARAGDGYFLDILGRPVLTISVHYLLTAPPVPGVVTRCNLWGVANDSDWRSKLRALKTVKNAWGREITGTWLQVVNENKRGAHWVDMKSSVTSEFNCNPRDLYGRCQPRTCESNDSDGQCQYIFPDVTPSSQRILEMKASKSDLLPGWRPGGTMTVYTDFELTTCPLNSAGQLSSSCNPNDEESDGKVREQAKRHGANAVVRYRLEVAEIDSTGSPANCAGPADSTKSPGWTFSPGPGAGTGFGNYKIETITDDAHHKKFYRSLTRRTSLNPECSRVLVRVFVEAIDGQPIKIDTSRVKNGKVRSMHTNGIVWLH